MIIILDANILISALISDSTTRRLIVTSNIPLYFPDIMLREVYEHEELILEKSGLSKDEYKQLLDVLLRYIRFISSKDMLENLNEATQIMSAIDIKDAPFIAAALSNETAVIWSDDKHFKRQSRIKSYTTTEIMSILEN